MTNKLDTGKIAQLLTLSSRQLGKSTLSSLYTARQNALKKQPVRAPVYALNTSHETQNLMPDSIPQWVMVGLLLAMLIIGMSFWHNIEEQQMDELDVAILTDDLPIEVFVD